MWWLAPLNKRQKKRVRQRGDADPREGCVRDREREREITQMRGKVSFTKFFFVCFCLKKTVLKEVLGIISSIVCISDIIVSMVGINDTRKMFFGGKPFRVLPWCLVLVISLYFHKCNLEVTCPFKITWYLEF